MKSREEQQAMVEKLKSPNMWTAFGGLTKEEQEFLNNNRTHVGFIGDYGKMHSVNDEVFWDMRVYRLLPDFTLPEPERWWYCNETHNLRSNDCEDRHCLGVCGKCFEVQASDLAYVKSVIERKDIDLKDYNLQSFYKEGDTVIWRFGEESVSNSGLDDCALMFVRKAKPEAKFVEYPITIREGKFYECGVVHIPEHCSLHELMDFVGFAGFKFLWEDGTETEWLEDCPLILHDGTPATPIKARFYIK